MFTQDEFVEFMGYREMLIQQKIEECIELLNNGAKEIEVSCGELTSDEMQRVYQEVLKKVGRGSV